MYSQSFASAAAFSSAGDGAHLMGGEELPSAGPEEPNGMVHADGMNLAPHTETYPCTYEGCTYVATHRRYITEHMRTHTGCKPYACTWPGCSYASSGSGHLSEQRLPLPPSSPALAPRFHGGARPQVMLTILTAASQLCRARFACEKQRPLTLGRRLQRGTCGSTRARSRTSVPGRAARKPRRILFPLNRFRPLPGTKVFGGVKRSCTRHIT